MKPYKARETRIKRVMDNQGERYCSQYKVVLIPHILWEWQSIVTRLDDSDYTSTLEEAKIRVDKFLLKDHYLWACVVEKEARKKVKREVEYIKYP